MSDEEELVEDDRWQIRDEHLDFPGLLPKIGATWRFSGGGQWMGREAAEIMYRIGRFVAGDARQSTPQVTRGSQYYLGTISSERLWARPVGTKKLACDCGQKKNHKKNPRSR